MESSEVVGKPVWEVVGVERYKEIRPHIELALTGKHVFVEIDVRHRTMGARRVQMNLVPDVDDQDNVHGFYAVGIDVTTRQS